MKLESKYLILHSRKCLRKCCLWNGRYYSSSPCVTFLPLIDAVTTNSNHILRLAAVDSNSTKRTSPGELLRTSWAVVVSHIVANKGLLAEDPKICENDISVYKLGQFAISGTCENWLGLVNSCVYYAHQTREIYQIPVLTSAVDFKAPDELWNPLSTTILSRCDFIWNKGPVNIWNITIKLKSNLYVRL